MRFRFLSLRIPRDNEKGPKTSEAVLNGIAKILKKAQGLISFELVAKEKFLYFFIVTLREYVNLIQGQLFSQYPSLEIDHVQDYVRLASGEQFAGAELYLSRTDLYPIKTYPHLEVDPLTHLAGVFAGFSKGEKAWIQILTRVVNEDSLKFKLAQFIKSSLRRKFRAGTEKYIQMLDKVEEEKVAKPLFRTKIRLLCMSPSVSQAQLQVQALAASFKHFSNPNLNSFKMGGLRKDKNFLKEYQQRQFLGKSYLLNSEEIASIFHLPYKGAEIPQVVETKARRVEPPVNLPKQEFLKSDQISVFGETTFRDEQIRFGIKREDRRRHVYIIGKTGMGKSKLLELLILSDIYAGKGICLMDPHGDLAEDVLRYIPDKRIHDVIYFNPADKKYPLGFNPMDNVESFEDKQIIVSGFIAIFKKLFSWNWNQRLEHMLRYTTLALLDYPESSVLGITKMLTDNLFRQKVVARIKDPLVKNFWATEFAFWNDQFAQEAIVPIINKVGQFVASPVIRNIVGQPKSTINIEKVIKEEKIVVANFSIGKLGEENSALLGAMFITKLWQASMAQASLPESERKDFYLYVDEFQNFATSAFANILSEARKYRLDLTVAHQYMKQLPEEVQATIFGNVGSIITFRVGAEDATILEKEFTPQVNTEDMINLDIRNVYVKMAIDGQTAKPFSAKTITLPKPDEDYSHQIIKVSRERWARKKTEVEKEIASWGKKDFSAEGFQQEEETKYPEPIV